MPSPTIVFLNSHADPATFIALNAFWLEFKKRNYIFSDEVERECTLIKNFREKNQDKLIELTKKTFNEISEIINLQCVRQQIPKIQWLPYGLFTPKKPGIRNFSTIPRSQTTFFCKSKHYLPVSKVLTSALSLVRH